MHQSTLREARPILFGEVLFDRFADGREVLGGAPFNVAWHLRGFGLDPLLITRVGRDARGDAVRRTMIAWGLATAGLEVDDRHPTGRVTAQTDDTGTRFEIEPEQAYDHIRGDVLERAATLGPVALVYHGTLALRNDASFAALERLLERTGAHGFVDLNLRPPWWTAARVDWALARARWVKVNDDELATLTGARCATEEDCAAAGLGFASRWSLERLVVTRGERGAVLLGDGRRLARTDAAEVAHFVDAVGAGDAFSAVALLGLVRAWDPEPTLARASRFAAEICGRRGATAPEPELYRRHLKAWQSEPAQGAPRPGPVPGPDPQEPLDPGKSRP
ncbi:MAG: carbohydrate kinase [Planctomycetes bacterium]|nr:carbohydrate kinase [Planctomycetota bacterium]